MTAIKKKTVNKSVVKKVTTKKVPTKKALAKKISVKKTEPKIIPAKKWDEGGVDIVKKTYNRLNEGKPYSVNVASTSINLKDLTPMTIFDFYEPKVKTKKSKICNCKFKLKSNGKYNVGKLKGLNILNKDGYVPLKVLILTLDKDEINLLKNGLPIKFILKK